ncbi:hypothetical protein [Streptomyces sp. NBC_00425]|uniref:hypothetical protein n=1 Tax=Streptomyces sp. NBC_00425 TaxID=2975740 RepID=UPI002E1DA87A
MKFDTEAEVRDFLRLCLEPRPGLTRTPARLAEIMPGPLFEALVRFAPHLRVLHDQVEEQEKAARAARRAYGAALAAWIEDEPAREDDALPPTLCEQNRLGDKAEPQYHHYRRDGAGVLRCVFCGVPEGWGDEPARGYRTPDGREWMRAAEDDERGAALYESPFVGTRFTALALEVLHGSIEDVETPTARTFVFKERSVNRTTKHIPSPTNHLLTLCRDVASRPMSAEDAARLALCGGCRKEFLDSLPLDLEAGGYPDTAYADLP